MKEKKLPPKLSKNETVVRNEITRKKFEAKKLFEVKRSDKDYDRLYNEAMHELQKELKRYTGLGNFKRVAFLKKQIADMETEHMDF